MPRPRRARPDLTESWDDVEENSNDSDGIDDADFDEYPDERTPRNRNTRNNRASRPLDSPRKRTTRSSLEPELVMPNAPNAEDAKLRSKTPHFRLNQRSMTSDAGDLDMGRNTARTQTPRFRLNERSMTSDAGKFARKPSVVVGGTLYEVDDDEDGASTYLKAVWDRVLGPVLGYFVDIVGQVLNKAKPAIAFALFAYLIVASLIFGSGFLTTSINNALTPICRIPGVTRFFHPQFCAHLFDSPEIQGPAEFEKLVQVQSAFNDVLVTSPSGYNLPMDIKRSEFSVRDLKTVVEYSTLPSKNELVYEFVEFISSSKRASDDLSKFNSQIGAAVDSVLSINRWTLRTISDIDYAEGTRGRLTTFLTDNLNIFAPFQPIPLSKDILVDQYLKHTAAVEEQIEKLITQARSLLDVLDSMDARLNTIAEIATRDGIKVEDNREELLTLLWTKLGGNRRTVERMNKQLHLLKDMEQYRRIAWAHVSTTVVKLQAIRADLEDLKDRVAHPETIGTARVPLEVHIEAINLGIERLAEKRDESRMVRDREIRRVLDGKESGVGGRGIGEREL